GALTDHAHAYAVAMQLGQVASDEAFHQTHEIVDLTRRARPVLRAKTVNGQVLDAELHRRAHRAPHGLDAAAMPLRSRQAALARPGTITVHNDGHVPRHFGARLPDRSVILLVHGSGVIPPAWHRIGRFCLASSCGRALHRATVIPA